MTLEDASRLENVMTVRLSPVKATLIGLALLAAAVLLGVAVVICTPLREMLPGYMKADQRAATQVNVMRLDSLRDVLMQREAYLSNIRTLLDTDRPVTPVGSADSDDSDMIAPEPDSLMESSERERRFIASMRDREKYNISVLAPLDADGMTFVSPAPRGIITSDSRSSERAVLALPAGTPVVAVADGRVISVSSGRAPVHMAVVVQHDNGFVSRYSSLETATVAPGDRVEAGQPIALEGARGDGGGRRAVLEMWHDSDPVVPYRYVGSEQQYDPPAI